MGYGSPNVLEQLNPFLISKEAYIEGEEWRDVVGYEGIYQISNLGRVRSLDRYISDSVGHHYKRRGRFIRPNFQRSGLQKNREVNGYIIVSLSKNGKNTSFGLHRLLAQAFISNPDPFNKVEVNHIDGIKFHNQLSNLEWVTPSENCKHAYINGLNPPRDRNELMQRLKLAIKASNQVRRHPVKCVDNGVIYPSVIEAQHALNISEWSILTSLKDGRPHGGYSFTRKGIEYE